MSATTPCVPCCTTPQTVQVPGTIGNDGDPGVDGSNGFNAYTTVSIANTVPASVGSTVLLDVVNSSWMVVGQPIYVEGGSNYVVTAIPSSTQVTLQWKGFEDDAAALSAIALGAGVSPGGSQAVTTHTRLTVYASGDPYPMKVTSELLDFGGTDPSLVLNEAGTWLIFPRARIDYFNATYAAATYLDEVPTFTLVLRETLNTNLNLDDSSTTFQMRDVTTAYFTAQTTNLPGVVYKTTSTTDRIQLWGSVSALPSTGQIWAVEADIVALKISESTT